MKSEFCHFYKDYFLREKRRKGLKTKRQRFSLPGITLVFYGAFFFCQVENTFLTFILLITALLSRTWESQNILVGCQPNVYAGLRAMLKSFVYRVL